jgi:RHS repeat-associated protein
MLTYQYTGRENDGNGLYYYRNRFLIHGVGAFASEDPMGFAAGQNKYLYANAMPTMYTDPSGEFIPGVPGLILGGVAGFVGDVFYQMLTKCEINWGHVAGATALGGSVGALTGGETVVTEETITLSVAAGEFYGVGDWLLDGAKFPDCGCGK